jgi:DNA-binding MarR family transcriptional regulator
MFHAALAQQRGLSATEEKALDLLLREGPMTHADLVQRTGLARASVSDLIDRLERKGYAQRAPHPKDGRRILVAADADRVHAELTPLFANWVTALEKLYANFSTEELETIHRFMTEAAARQRDAATSF